ncbi:MAG TPA: ElyC/SanA/YdcF family protein [Bacteroidia bacterium]|jgi:SanA protein|nr:ElyC/SanA/YdcF family protein [Bacteroidia bacterium]
MVGRRILKSKIVIATLVLVAVAVAFTYWANYKITSTAKPYVFDNIADVPETKVGLLLGASRLTANGYENYYFNYRINAALELFHAGKIKYIIVSGDNSRKTYDEPTDMKNALLAGGVPDSVIYLDYAGFRTFDSVIRAKEIFSQTKLVIISQKFHNERAVFIARNNDIEAYGCNAQDLTGKFGAKTNRREFFAKAKVFLDMLIDREPKFLGEKIQIGK